MWSACTFFKRLQGRKQVNSETAWETAWLCLSSKRGKHWANKCRSKTDTQANTLFPNKGNGSRGQLKVLNQYKPKHAYGVVSFMPASNNSPFQNLVEQPRTGSTWQVTSFATHTIWSPEMGPHWSVRTALTKCIWPGSGKKYCCHAETTICSWCYRQWLSRRD